MNNIAKTLQSNWRELVAVAAFIAVLLVGLALLGSPSVASSGPLSNAVSVLVTIIGAVAKFVTALALGWFGLAVTFPEANKFVVGDSFDIWWGTLRLETRAIVALCAAGVLAIVAAICMTA